MNNPWKEYVFTSIKLGVVLSVFTSLILFFYHNEVSWSIIKSQVFYNFYFGIPLYIVNSLFFKILSAIYPWDRSPLKRTIIGVLGSVILTMMLLLILVVILFVNILDYDIDVIFSKTSRWYYIIGFIMTIIMSSVFHAVHFFKELLASKELNAILKEQKLRSDLSTLRAHLDPHFLFNSFNVLSGLIDESPKKAQRFLNGLSDIYRYILEHRQEELISLSDELKFSNQYLRLYEMRFSNCIVVEKNIPARYYEKKLPALSLQLLLENAVKHNKFDASEPLQICFEIEDEQLVVSNIKNLRHNSSGEKLGLENISKRYSLLSQKDVEIIDAEKSFIVKLPLL